MSCMVLGSASSRSRLATADWLRPKGWPASAWLSLKAWTRVCRAVAVSIAVRFLRRAFSAAAISDIWRSVSGRTSTGIVANCAWPCSTSSL